MQWTRMFIQASDSANELVRRRPSAPPPPLSPSLNFIFFPSTSPRLLWPVRKSRTVFNLVGLSFPPTIHATPYSYLSYIPLLFPLLPFIASAHSINSPPPSEGADLTPLSTSLLPHWFFLHITPSPSNPSIITKTPLTGNHVDKQQFFRCHISETINRCHLMTGNRALPM